MVGALLAVSLLLAPVLSVPSWTEQTVLPDSGAAKMYKQGLMARVAEYRYNEWGLSRCQDCVGEVAMMRRGDLGRKVWIEVKGQVVGPLLVIDCAQWKHFPGRIARGDIIELSYELWQELGLPADVVEIKVHDKDPQASPKRTFVSKRYEDLLAEDYGLARGFETIPR